jgi:hypothetical protein
VTYGPIVGPQTPPSDGVTPHHAPAQVLATCLVKYRPVSAGAGSVSPSDLLEACAAGEVAAKEAEAFFVSPSPTPELAALIEYDRQASRALRPPQLEA